MSVHRKVLKITLLYFKSVKGGYAKRDKMHEFNPRKTRNLFEMFAHLFGECEEACMFKNALRTVSVIALISFLLAACGAKPTTPAPSTVAPVNPATAAPATTAPVTAAPAATQGGAPAAGTNWCSGTSIVFFPGGSAGGGFETVVYNGAVQAAKDTGANVQYVWSDWDPSKMVTQL